MADRFAVFIQEDDVEILLNRLFREWKEAAVPMRLPVCVGIYPHRMDGIPVGMAYDRAKIACDTLKGTYASSFRYYDKTLKNSIIPVWSEDRKAICFAAQYDVPRGG